MANETFAKKFDEAIADKRHKQMVGALENFAKSLAAVKTQDPELKRLIAGNVEAMTSLVERMEKLNTSHTHNHEIKVDNHQSDVVKSIDAMTEAVKKIFESLDRRITALENKPRPKMLRPVKDDYLGTIKHVIIEYEK